MQIPTWRLRRDDWDIEGLPEPRRLPATLGHLQMIRQGKLIFLRLLQRIIIFAVRPYVVRELPGWGLVYGALVGDYRRNWLWATAPKMRIQGKMHGYVMQLDLSRWSDRAAFFLGRWYALDIQLFLKDVVQLGDVVVDVGSNRGMFTLLASSLVGLKGKVICFEPNPHCVELLDRELSENSINNAVVHRCGLGDKSGVLGLSVPDINSGEGTYGLSSYPQKETSVIQTNVRVGDELLIGEKPTLIKIDVEGFEVRVIEGLKKTLSIHRPIIITEVISHHLIAAGSSVSQMLAVMESLDYEGFALSTQKIGQTYRWKLAKLDLASSEGDAVWFHRSAAVPECVVGNSGL